ncbi:galactose oxidase [Neoconidiobolus thromboides FSU 785]|nr:galactose oxidase [Neoconidiobolus thromboides FSU 785]
MILILTLLIIQSNSIIFAANAPRLYAGGCGVYNDVLYYAGGIIDPDGTHTKNDNNLKVYSLKLKDGFSLDDNNNAPWQVASNDQGPISDFTSVVINNNNASLFVIGGKNRPKEDIFEKFNLLKNKWESNQVAVDTFPASNKSVTDEDIKYAYYSSSLTQDSKNKNLYFHFGGATKSSNKTSINGRKSLSLLNAVDGTWRKLKDGPDYVADHVAAVYDSKLYVVGGSNPYTREIKKMDEIMIYDYPSNSWGIMTAKGDIPEPRFGHSSTLVGSKMIIAGGSLDNTYDSFPSSSIYTLELKDSALIYKGYKVGSFFNAYLGSLTYYNDHLIYTFGYHTGYLLSKSQIINMNGNEWKLVQSLPANAQNSGNDLNRGSPNLTAIIGGSVGGALALLFIIALIWYLLKKKSKIVNNDNVSITKEELGPPALLEGNVWTSTDPGEIKEANFTLDTETMLPGFDDDLTHPSSHTWSNNTNTR